MAVALVRRRTAPLEAWYCGLELSVPTRPSWDEMLTMEPPPARRMAGIAARVPRKTPVELTAMIRSQSARVVSSIRLPPPMPALLTRTSSFPYTRSASVTAPAQSDSLVTSRRTNVASPPAARISSTVFLPSASRTSPSMTFAPSFVNRRPASAPIPRAPPLISATFPSSLMCPSPVRASGLLVDRFRQEEDVLRPLEVAFVKLADQLLPRRGGEVLLILLGVVDLDPLDVVPARILGPIDGPLDPVRGVARDARQGLRHLVIVLAYPLLVGGRIHSLLQRRDHIPHFHCTLPHPPATGSKQSSRSPSWRTRFFSQAAPLTATNHVSGSAPSALSRDSIVVAGATSMVVRSRPSGRNRRRLPCMFTLIRAPHAPAASPRSGSARWSSRSDHPGPAGTPRSPRCHSWRGGPPRGRSR